MRTAQMRRIEPNFSWWLLLQLYWKKIIRAFSIYCEGHGVRFHHQSPCQICGKRIRPGQVGKYLEH